MNTAGFPMKGVQCILLLHLFFHTGLKHNLEIITYKASLMYRIKFQDTVRNNYSRLKSPLANGPRPEKNILFHACNKVADQVPRL